MIRNNKSALQPRLGFVVPLWPRGLILQGSWSRYGQLLQGRYLDFGNPAALGVQVFGWQDSNGDGEDEGVTNSVKMKPGETSHTLRGRQSHSESLNAIATFLWV